mgnify:CR=1 FL=1
MDLYTVRNNIMKGVPLQELNLRVCFYARVSTDKDEHLHSSNNLSKKFHLLNSYTPYCLANDTFTITNCYFWN